MEDHGKAREQLLDELLLLRHRVATLEAAETERKRGESPLRKSEERYRLLVESIPQAVWRADANGETSEWNNHWCEYTGQTYEEARGFGWMKALHLDDVERVTERVREAQDSGELCQVEFRVRRASDGSYRWHLARALPMKDEDGKITGWFGSVTDIDDQKRTEEELRTSRAILRATIDHLPFDFFAIGMDGRYTLQNATSKAHWGDAVGKLPEDTAGNEENLTLWRENNRRAFAGEKVEGEVTLTIKGETSHLYNILTPIRIDGGICGILGMNVDITERKRAEAALLESEGRFRSLFQDSSVGTVVVTPNGQFSQVNRAFCDFLGYPEQELVGKTVLSITHPEDREVSSTVIRQAAELGPRIHRLEKRYVHRNGQVVWGEVSSTPICDAAGKPSHFITQVLDISERKRAEEGLRNSERTLRAMIDANPESILLLDTEGTVLIANEAAAHRLGKTVAEITGDKAPNLVPPEVAARRNRHLAEVVRIGKPIRFEDERNERYYENALYPVFDESGRVVSVAVLSIDRTRRKRTEEALQKAHDELERRVEERTAELATANKQLRCEIENRKRIEIALSQSEEKYKSLVEVSPDTVLMVDLERNITYASQRSTELFGYDSVEDLRKQKATALVVKEERQRLTANLSLLLQQGVRRQIEYIGLRRDGSRFTGEVSSAVLRDDRGEPTAFMAVVRDVTEHKWAEETVQQSRDELQAIYDGMVDGLLVTDVETMRFVRVNASICQMLGYSEEELLSLSVGDIHPAEALPHILENIRLAEEANQPPTGNIPVVRKDGSVFYAEVIGKFLVYDGRPCSMGIFRDITERRQAQEALRQSHDELQAIYDQVEDGIVIVDIERPEPIRANAAICRMLGYSEQEMKTVLPAQVHPSEAMSKILDHLQAVAQGRVARFDNMPFLRRDGSVFYADVVSSRILYNERFCRISFLHDVTERRAAEEALAESEAKYRHLVETTDTGYLILDEEGRVADANAEYVRLTGHHDSK